MEKRLAWGPLILALIATGWLIYLLEPMGSVIMWSIILTVLFTKVNERLAVKFDGRNRAAFATLGIIALTAIVPFVLVTIIVSGQLVDLVNNSDEIMASGSAAVSSATASLPESVRNWISDMTEAIDLSTEQIGRVVSYSVTLGSNVALFFGSVLAVMYVTFFLLRDKERILHFISAGVPLTEEQKSFLSTRLANTMSATVRGVILVAAAQSLVAGLIYALLGIQFFAVLTALTFVVCLIPAVGSGLVWVPVAICFFLIGEPVKGFIMLGTGMFVISMIDNLLRPRLIAEKAALPDFLIFLSSIGGMAAIGFNGLFLGPIVAAFFIESWNVYNGVYRGEIPGGDEAKDSR